MSVHAFLSWAAADADEAGGFAYFATALPKTVTRVELVLLRNGVDRFFHAFATRAARGE